MKRITSIFFILLNYSLFSQVVELYSNDFESATPLTYEQTGTSVNTWKIAVCAGNGNSQPGINSLYVSKGGINTGCGTDGDEQYAFSPAPSTSERMIASVEIDGSCTKNHVISFDYKLNPTDQTNRAYVVYSLNNGAFWFIQDTLSNTADWTSVSVDIDEATNNNGNFLVGVRFDYGNVSGNGDPLAIDNMVVSGTFAGADIALDTLAVCGQSSVVISAAGNISGTGEWTLLNGQGTFNNPSAYQTGVNNLGIGTSVFVWSVTSVTCGNSSDTLVVINSLAPSFANVQDTVFACSAEQLNISTTAPMAGTGIWTSPQGTNISSPNSPSVSVTNIPDGWSQLIWTVSAPGCPSNADTMNIFKTGGQAILTPDTNICYETNPVLLIEATPIDSLQTLEWLFYAGNGLIHSAMESSTEVSGLQMGENLIIYNVTHELCPKESDTIRIYMMPCEDFEPVFPTVITPNNDGKNDLFVIHNLENIYPNCQITIFNRWGNVVFESTGYSTPWDGTFNGEKLPMGTYFFKLELNDESNSVYNGPISIIH